MEEFSPPVNIDDAVLEKFAWGEIRWIWNAMIDTSAEQTLGQVIIYPGKKNTAHIHPNCEELMYILEGECDHWLGDEVFHLKPGMTIIIPRDELHYALVTSVEPLKALIFYSTPVRETKAKE